MQGDGRSTVDEDVRVKPRGPKPVSEEEESYNEDDESKDNEEEEKATAVWVDNGDG